MINPQKRLHSSSSRSSSWRDSRAFWPGIHKTGGGGGFTPLNELLSYCYRKRSRVVQKPEGVHWRHSSSWAVEPFRGNPPLSATTKGEHDRIAMKKAPRDVRGRSKEPIVVRLLSFADTRVLDEDVRTCHHYYLSTLPCQWHRYK